MKTIRLQFLSFALALAFCCFGTSQSAIAQTMVDAGADSISVCSGEIIGLGGFISAGTASWVGGAGSFDPSRNVLNPLYTAATSEYGTTIVLVLREDAAPNATDTIRIFLLPTPTLAITPAIANNVCPSTSVDLSSAFIVNDTTFTTGFITYFDDGGGAPGMQLGSPVVSPPVGVPTLYYINKTTFTTPSCFDFEPVTVFISACPSCTAPEPTASITNATCNGDSDGAIDVTVTSGTPPYSYAWSTGATTEDITALAAGNYTLTVTDSDSIPCDTTVVYNITEPALVTATITPLGNAVQCAPLFLTMTANGGAGLTYLWTNGETTSFITVTASDSITVTVTDTSSGCAATSDVLPVRTVNVKKLGAAFCGRMNLSTNTVLYSEYAWSSPYQTQWEWEIKNKTTQVTNNYITNEGTLPLTTTFVEDNENYRVRTRLLIDSTIVCDWGDSCMIGTMPKSGITPGTLIIYDCDKPAAPRTAIIAELVTEGATPAIQYEYSWYSDSNLTNLVSRVAIYGRLCPFSSVPGIATSTKYWVTVRGYVPLGGGGAGGWGPIGSVCTVTPQSLARFSHDDMTGLEDETFSVIAAPNPFDNSFLLHIQAFSDRPVDVQIVDMTGRVVQELFNQDTMNPIELGTDLSTGIYFTRVSQGTTTRVVKMIKTDY